MIWQDVVLRGLAEVGIIVALASWLGKFWASRFLERDRIKYETQMHTVLEDLQTRDSKELFVHRLQFEKEFEIYSLLWEGMVDLGRAAGSFRAVQTGQFKPPDVAAQDLEKSYNALGQLVHKSRPFYSPTVFDTAKWILNKAAEAHSGHQHVQSLQKKPESQADRLVAMEKSLEKTVTEISDLIDDLADAIRDRIWSTKRTGWDRGNSR